MSLTVPREDRSTILSAQFTALPQVRHIRVPGDAYYEVLGLQAVDDARASGQPASGYRLMISDSGSANNRWFLNPIVSDLVFGRPANPRQLRTPIILAPNTVITLEATATDLTTAFNRFDVALWTVRRYQMSANEYAARRQRPYFVYNTSENVDVTGSTGFTSVLQIHSDSDFQVQSLCGVGIFNRISGGSGLSDWGAVRVQITDLSSDKRFFENPMGWFQVVGQPDVWMGPNRLLSPMVFRRQSQIQVDVIVDTNESADVGIWRDIQIGFEGYKIKD